MRKILAAAAAIITLAGAWAVVDQYAPWAKASEFFQLAGDVYRDKAILRYDQVLRTEEAIERAAKEGQPDRVRDLRARKDRLEREKRQFESRHEDFLKRQRER